MSIEDSKQGDPGRSDRASVDLHRRAMLLAVSTPILVPFACSRTDSIYPSISWSLDASQKRSMIWKRCRVPLRIGVIF